MIYKNKQVSDILTNTTSCNYYGSLTNNRVVPVSDVLQ